MQVMATHVLHVVFCIFFFFFISLSPIETNLGEPPLRFTWNKVVMITRVRYVNIFYHSLNTSLVPYFLSVISSFSEKTEAWSRGSGVGQQKN